MLVRPVSALDCPARGQAARELAVSVVNPRPAIFSAREAAWVAWFLVPAGAVPASLRWLVSGATAARG